jgi:molybdenum cofactor biosynthesis protein MoaC
MKLLNDFFAGAHYNMIAVGNKATTKRIALASGHIHVNNIIFQHIKNNTLPKGNVLALAEIAGIMGAKKTAEILPLCHPLPLEQVAVKTVLVEADCKVQVFAVVSATAKTGVEMEALSAVNAALLCIYDLCKMYGQDMVLNNSRLLYKEGGKSEKIGAIEYLPEELKCLLSEPRPYQDISCAIVTISDRAARGEYADKSGEYLRTQLTQLSDKPVHYAVVADECETISATIKALSQSGVIDIIFTTGGTGIGKRDRTIEAIKPLLNYEIPGLAELLRSHGANFTNFAWLSRQIAGVIHKTLIVTFPGSETGVKQCFSVIEKLLPHAHHILNGGGHD